MVLAWWLLLLLLHMFSFAYVPVCTSCPCPRVYAPASCTASLTAREVVAQIYCRKHVTELRFWNRVCCCRHSNKCDDHFCVCCIFATVGEHFCAINTHTPVSRVHMLLFSFVSTCTVYTCPCLNTCVVPVSIPMALFCPVSIPMSLFACPCLNTYVPFFVRKKGHIINLITRTF